jgi:uncharacterized protein (DUF427 family)
MTTYRIDQTPRRIRAQHHGLTVADSLNAQLVYVEGRPPDYHIPVADIDWQVLSTVEGKPADSPLGARVAVVGPSGRRLGHRIIDGAAADLVHLDFDSMSAWFEEDEQIHGRPRDPYRRVDVLESSRRVEVTVAGVSVAATNRPRLVLETGLPGRWYVPRADVQWAPLHGSTTSSYCQYKGSAEWWHFLVNGGETLVDIAWGYERPIPEATKLAGLVCFYAEHEAVRTTVDGESDDASGMTTPTASPSLEIMNSNT